MLLFSLSLLVALYAKGRLATPVFVIISYAIWTFIIVRWGIVSDVDVIPIKAIISLFCSVALHEGARFMRRKEKLRALRLAKIMAWALFLVLVLVSALIVAKAISDADKLVSKQDVSSIEWKPLEHVGKGVIHERYKNEWTLLDAALTTNNVLYDITLGARVDVLTHDEDGFKVKGLTELYDDMPSMFHARLAKSGSPVEAMAMKGRIHEYLGNLEKLQASGWSGIGVAYLANFADV